MDERVRSLVESPAPAVLTTYREDGSALVTPVWCRFAGPAFEIVRSRSRARRSSSTPTWRRRGAGRHLGAAAGERSAEERRSKPGVLLRLRADCPRVWELSAILPS